MLGMIFRAGLVALIFAGLMAVGSMARAHKASSGQDYDVSCCGGHDCRQLTDADVPKELQAVDDGWMIIPTGEHFLATDREHVKTSTDGSFHRCSANNGAVTGRTFCLYVPAQA